MYISFALLVFLSPYLQVIATFILFGVYAFFYAFTEGAQKAFVADLVTDENRGTAFGLFNFSIGLGALPASIILRDLFIAPLRRSFRVSGEQLLSVLEVR